MKLQMKLLPVGSCDRDTSHISCIFLIPPTHADFTWRIHWTLSWYAANLDLEMQLRDVLDNCPYDSINWRPFLLALENEWVYLRLIQTCPHSSWSRCTPISTSHKSRNRWGYFAWNVDYDNSKTYTDQSRENMAEFPMSSYPKQRLKLEQGRCFAVYN